MLGLMCLEGLVSLVFLSPLALTIFPRPPLQWSASLGEGGVLCIWLFSEPALAAKSEGVKNSLGGLVSHVWPSLLPLRKTKVNK